MPMQSVSADVPYIMVRVTELEQDGFTLIYE
jgi:hypothetical protein